MIVCGTGHRPKYCPCKYKFNHPWLIDLKKDLKQKLLEFNVRTVISGMAIGWDTWIAQEALSLDIPVHAYVPFRGQEKAWPSDSRKMYEDILVCSEKVIYVNEEYSAGAFLERDRAMVDNSEHVFALLNPASNSGGTFYTVNYAKQNKKPVTNFWRD
jgi:uncharacterized phage-like protein YoqJ